MTRLALCLTLTVLAFPGCTGEGKTDAKTTKKKQKKKKKKASSSDEGSGGGENPLATGGSTPTEAAGAEGLKTLMEKLFAAQKAKDAEAVAEIARGLMPDLEHAKRALADGCDPKVVQKLDEALAKRPPDDDPRWAKMFRFQPKRTEIRVHPATPAEIAAQETPASKEYPGGAVKAAKQGVLRPDVTFYEVEFTEPGKSMGMKYHLLFHDGDRWRMLGKIWRAMR